MAGKPCIFLGILLLSIVSDASDWNILNEGMEHKLGYKLRNDCESWRMNVELNNIRAFEVVPGECVPYMGSYMTSTQYKVDVERALEQCTLYLGNNFCLTGGNKDAWILDIDDTLFSIVPSRSITLGNIKMVVAILSVYLFSK